MGINTFQNLGESARLVPGLGPVDINGGKNSQFFNLNNYEHASVLLAIGTQNVASTITVTQSQDSSGTGETAIGFDYYPPGTTGNDVNGARATATSAGVATDGATANIVYCIELQAANLTPGYNWVRVKMSNPGATGVLASILPVLTTARYAGQPANMPSALV